MKTSGNNTSGNSCCSADNTARGSPASCRRPSMSVRYISFGLFAVLFICLIIFSTVQVSEGGPVGRRKQKKRQENDVAVEANTRRPSRQGNKKILKGSEEALNITEKRYLKKDWCRKQPLKQIIHLKNGCEGVFLNNFCYGQCNSFYIPRELTPEAREQEAFKSCSFCKPYKVVKVSVTLRCPRKRRRAKKIKKMINRITECHCVAIPDIDSRTPAPVRSM